MRQSNRLKKAKNPQITTPPLSLDEFAEGKKSIDKLPAEILSDTEKALHDTIRQFTSLEEIAHFCKNGGTKNLIILSLCYSRAKIIAQGNSKFKDITEDKKAALLKIKEEIYKQRNVICASKSRVTKREKIAELENNIVELKKHNSLLLQELTAVRKEKNHLMQQMVPHPNNVSAKKKPLPTTEPLPFAHPFLHPCEVESLSPLELYLGAPTEQSISLIDVLAPPCEAVKNTYTFCYSHFRAPQNTPSVKDNNKTDLKEEDKKFSTSHFLNF